MLVLFNAVIPVAIVLFCKNMFFLRPCFKDIALVPRNAPYTFEALLTAPPNHPVHRPWGRAVARDHRARSCQLLYGGLRVLLCKSVSE